MIIDALYLQHLMSCTHRTGQWDPYRVRGVRYDRRKPLACARRRSGPQAPPWTCTLSAHARLSAPGSFETSQKFVQHCTVCCVRRNGRARSRRWERSPTPERGTRCRRARGRRIHGAAILMRGRRVGFGGYSVPKLPEPFHNTIVLVSSRV